MVESDADGAPPEKRFLLAFTIITTFPVNRR
jgi:hypothetical protein